MAKTEEDWPHQSGANLSGSAEEETAQNLLAPLRAEIDALDHLLIDLLKQRFAVVQRIAACKAEHGIPTVDPQRMAEIKMRIADRAATEGMQRQFIHDLFDLLFAESIQYENRLMGRDHQTTAES